MRWGWYPKNQLWVDFPYQTTIMDGRKPGFFSICASGLSICSGWIITFSAPRLLDPVDTPWTKNQRRKSVGNLPFVSRKERHFWASQTCGDFFVMFWNFNFTVWQFVSLVDIISWIHESCDGFHQQVWPPTHCLRSGLRRQSNWRRMVALHLRFVPWWCTCESCFECPFGDIAYIHGYENQ